MMKFVLSLYIFCAIYFNCLSSRALALYEDKKNYETMMFDTVLRGSWMLDRCAADLFNCYEIVKGDVVCSYSKYFSSVCAVQRDYCHNQKGMRDDHVHRYELFEEECLNWRDKYNTRRLGVHLY